MHAIAGQGHLDFDALRFANDTPRDPELNALNGAAMGQGILAMIVVPHLDERLP